MAFLAMCILSSECQNSCNAVPSCFNDTALRCVGIVSCNLNSPHFLPASGQVLVMQKALDRFLLPDARQMVHELTEATGPGFRKLNNAVRAWPPVPRTVHHLLDVATSGQQDCSSFKLALRCKFVTNVVWRVLTIHNIVNDWLIMCSSVRNLHDILGLILQVAALLDDYGMVSFVPLDVSNEER